MRILPTLILSLLLPLAGVAQESPVLTDEEASFQKIVQLAALTPNSAEFSQAWTDHVVNYVKDPAMVDAAIDSIIGASNDFRREFRGGWSGSGGPALKYHELKNLMSDIAAKALNVAEIPESE